MTEPANGRGDGKQRNCDAGHYLDDRLRDLDEYLSGIFINDVDDIGQRSRFLESIVRLSEFEVRGHRARTMTARRWLTPCYNAGGGARRLVLMTGAALSVILVVLVAKLFLQPLLRETNTVSNHLEKPGLRFSVMKTTDLAPFWLAVQNGYFEKAGFRFDPWKDVTVVSSGADSVARLTASDVDIAYSTYPPFFMTQAQRTADIKLVADASSARPGSCMVVAMPGSRIKDIRDMVGARVAVTARNTISELLVKAALKSAGVDWASIQWIEVPFEDMPGKLAVGAVDAAFMTEPYLSHASKTVGAVPIFDTAATFSPTASMPTAGFAVTAEFAEKYPRTVAAFQRVMEQATAEALADRTKVEPLLEKYAGVDPDIASSATVLGFESRLEAVRIQRVPDVMMEFGMIHERIDALQMIAKPRPDR